MAKDMTVDQLRAMFSKAEISRGISKSDINRRKRELGILPEQQSFKKNVFTSAGSPREEFKRGAVTVKGERVKLATIPEEARDKMLPTRFDIIKSGERKGELIRKRKFGTVPNPTEAASEAQKEAVRRFTEESPSSATNLSIYQLLSSGKLKNMTFKQLSDQQKKQFEVLRGLEPARHRQILAMLRANETPRPVSELTKQEASDILKERERQRKDQIIFGLQGQLPDDPVAQRIINNLTQGQRNAAVEELFSFAKAKGRTSPTELTPGQVNYVLSQVKRMYTREGVRKIQ